VKISSADKDQCGGYQEEGGLHFGDYDSFGQFVNKAMSVY
jgi:hypothetical protein